VARSNRRRGASRSRQSRKDWVYLQQSYGVDSVFLAPGSVGAVALPLTISQNARRHITFGTISTEPVWADQFQVQSGASMPEGSKQRVYAVEADLMVIPNDLTAGSFFRFGWRLLHGEMYNLTGELNIDAGYSMFEDTSANSTVAMYANAGFLKENRDAQYFSTAVAGLVNRAAFNYSIRWSNPRGITLGNDRAMFLWLETSAVSRELSVFAFCRTLCEAPSG